MQTILCDTCKAEIHETAQELVRISGRVANAMDSGPVIANRQTMSMHILCDRCADWLLGAQAHLAESLSPVSRRRVRPTAERPRDHNPRAGREG